MSETPQTLSLEKAVWEISAITDPRRQVRQALSAVCDMTGARQAALSTEEGELLSATGVADGVLTGLARTLRAGQEEVAGWSRLELPNGCLLWISTESPVHPIMLAVCAMAANGWKLYRLSITDDLTGLSGRAAFERAVDGAIRRGKRMGIPFSLLFIDLDHFGMVNKTNGFAVGDEVLKRVADVLRQEARDEDELGRLGGEEIGWLLQDSDVEIATKVAERLRQEVEKDIRILEILGRPLTCSIGVASWRQGMTRMDLFIAADEALRRAKGQGRNRVEAAE